MTTRRTAMSPAPHLGLPTFEPPEPVPGCGECTRLADTRLAARTAGDYTTVTDCDIRMRRHAEGHR